MLGKEFVTRILARDYYTVIGQQREDADHDVVVAGEDAGHELLAQARDAEDVLDHDRARDDAGDERTEDGHDRDERVAQRVPRDRDPSLQALSPGRAHVVGPYGLEHARPGQPRDVAGV